MRQQEIMLRNKGVWFIAVPAYTSFIMKTMCFFITLSKSIAYTLHLLAIKILGNNQ